MKDDIFHFLAGRLGEDPDRTFNDLALRVFRYQFERNAPYHQYCDSKNARPETIHNWEAIPALPVTAFKWAEITCRPINEAVRTFHSSGTTRGELSRHFLFDEYMAKGAILTHFKRHILPDRDQIRMMILTPTPEADPHASLSYMMSVVREIFGTEKSGYYIKDGVLESTRLAKDLESANEAVTLLGTSFSFVHFFDHCQKHDIHIKLPAQSRLMDTGGFKGRSREVSQAWIYEQAEKHLNIPDAYCVNEYGMSEMTSQFYDRVVGKTGPRLYVAPPQVRTGFLSLETLEPIKEGEVGILVHVDLANCDTVAAILTEDLGRQVGDKFTLLGRASDAELKGCSISLDELLKRSDSQAADLSSQT
ncbi:hypothetical protein JYT87_01445 [Nitrospira defluvii]|nr:hypothetical protein [Nitrospira defluvii]